MFGSWSQLVSRRQMMLCSFVWLYLIKTNSIIDELFYWRCPYCLSFWYLQVSNLKLKWWKFETHSESMKPFYFISANIIRKSYFVRLQQRMLLYFLWTYIVCYITIHTSQSIKNFSFTGGFFVCTNKNVHYSIILSCQYPFWAKLDCTRSVNFVAYLTLYIYKIHCEKYRNTAAPTYWAT